jgi:hypothetical protein
MPAQTRLPVKKNTKIAANPAMGNAKKKPMTKIANRPMISKTNSSHQKPMSEGLRICIANKN